MSDSIQMSGRGAEAGKKWAEARLHHGMEFGRVEEVGAEMWISLSRSLEVKGRQAGRQAAGSRLLTADNMEGQRPEGTGWEQGDKSELGFNKRRRKCFCLNSSKNATSSHV